MSVVTCLVINFPLTTYFEWAVLFFFCFVLFSTLKIIFWKTWLHLKFFVAVNCFLFWSFWQNYDLFAKKRKKNWKKFAKERRIVEMNFGNVNLQVQAPCCNWEFFFIRWTLVTWFIFEFLSYDAFFLHWSKFFKLLYKITWYRIICSSILW